MKQYLVIARHGEYGSDDRSSLSESGRKQIVGLKKVIDGFFENVFGDKPPKRICFSFSNYPRAIQSIQELVYDREDIILTELFMANRESIYKPQDILKKVMGVAGHYGANIIVIIAHGDMPAVLTETVHEAVTGKKFDNKKPDVAKACGYITDMTTGEVAHIRYDDLDAKLVPPLVALERSRPVYKGAPRSGNVVRKGGPGDFNDDLPF